MIEAGPVVRAYNRVGTRIFVRLLSLMLASTAMSKAETPDPAASPDSTSAAKPAPKDRAKRAAQEDTLDSVYVEGKRWLFNRRTRYAHSLPEVDGPTITVTKKTRVVAVL